MSGLPSFGDFNGAYALLINHTVVAQRHATDAVTAVNFDYRAMDTMGEEFIRASLGARTLPHALVELAEAIGARRLRGGRAAVERVP